jgi:DNA-binding transcriptional regulator GbsR (MarR family)
VRLSTWRRPARPLRDLDDVWELLRTIVRERQRREIAPTIEVLRELLADPALSKDPAEAGAACARRWSCWTR